MDVDILFDIDPELIDAIAIEMWVTSGNVKNFYEAKDKVRDRYRQSAARIISYVKGKST